MKRTSVRGYLVGACAALPLLAYPVVMCYRPLIVCGTSCLENAANIVKSASTKARAKAIATRDVHHLLIFLSDASARVALTADARVSKEFPGSANTMVIVDEGERFPEAECLQPVDDPIGLPKSARFVRGCGASAYPAVVDILFLATGSLVISNATDRSEASLRIDEGDLERLVEEGEDAPWSKRFDLVLSDDSFEGVAILDFCADTGSVDYRYMEE